MNIKVTKDRVIIEDDYYINKGEYNVNKCYFDFSEEYDGLTKKAIFKYDDVAIEVPITLNECIIPHEVLNFNIVELRVYAYSIENEELVLRYSPTYTEFETHRGSYIDGTSESEEVTPSQFEQYSQKLNEGLERQEKALEDLDKVIKTIDEGVNYAKEQGDYAKKQGNYAKETADSMANKIIEIKNSIPKNVSDLNNDKGFIDNLVDDLVNYYTKNETFTKEEINNLVSQIPKFKIEVVQTLPTENISLSSIYLVPSSSDEEDIYKEYIYTNDRWELLGIQKVDLSDYYKKNEVDNLLLSKVDKTTLGDYYTSEKIDTLLANKVNLTTLDNYVKNTDYPSETKGGIIKVQPANFIGVGESGNLMCVPKTYQQYSSGSNYSFISKGTLENVLAEKIGSINTILDSINGEVI